MGSYGYCRLIHLKYLFIAVHAILMYFFLGPSHYSAPRSYMPKGATGFGVQVLYDYLKSQSSQ